jgi:hypothetical protein
MKRAAEQPMTAEDTRAWVGVIKWCAKVQERLDAEREGRPMRIGWWDMPARED